jgi:hypothetical protein
VRSRGRAVEGPRLYITRGFNGAASIHYTEAAEILTSGVQKAEPGLLVTVGEHRDSPILDLRKTKVHAVKVTCVEMSLGQPDHPSLKCNV